ncbi:hypothetical protein GCM10011316_20270 [Roseibium aquae]|uniref:DUF2157 domain-containing protein n=1 Tax=Roseibium aquae TaxID=1323746 RepID=A0A916TJK1_9HYPH|nr:hypothetical protein [Roseibium aquae]GGB48093.1 hypothetical protein GCM10011316_20270 [Roseibium aquae]
MSASKPPAPLEPDRLAAAVEAGILSEHQADRLAEFWQGPASDLRSSADLTFADREEVRFVRGFHDIFISIGLVVLLFGMTFGLQSFLPAWGIAAVIAGAIWILAEVFSKRMRLALPSFLLNVAFLPAFFAACFGLVVDQDLSVLDQGDWVHENEAVLVLPAIFLVAAATVLFYWRFKVPVGIAAITAIGLFLVAMIVEMILPGLIENNSTIFLLGFGLVTFALAMAYDMRDPQRLTLNSDKAFWLHLMAAPLIVHSVLSLVADVYGDGSLAYSVTVIVLFLVLAAIALIVDRRALLVSAMSYLGFAIGYLISEANVSEEAAFAATLVVLGGFILLIGSAWHVLRRFLLRPLAGQALLHRLPDPR